MLRSLWLFVLLYLDATNTLKTPATRAQKLLQRRKRKGIWKVAWQCPYYKVYSKIIEKPEQVCEEWRHSFMNFKQWMSSRNHVDRVLCTQDTINALKNSGLRYEIGDDTQENYYYSPENSFFIPREVFALTRLPAIEKEFDKRRNTTKFKTLMQKFGAEVDLGLFDNEEDAINNYNREKGMYMIQIAELLADPEDEDLKKLLLESAATLLVENEKKTSRRVYQTEKRTICNIGINDADYATHSYIEINGRKEKYMDPYYAKWKAMIERCYSSRYQDIKYENNSYYGCTVVDEWHRYSNFAAWMKKQNWIDRNLDKNLICPGSKVYSPETCLFVPAEINTLLSNTAKNNKQNNKKGVTWNKSIGKYKASITMYSKSVHLGYFSSAMEAHREYLKAKGLYLIEIAKGLDTKMHESDQKLQNVLLERARVDYNVTVDDHKNSVVNGVLSVGEARKKRGRPPRLSIEKIQPEDGRFSYYDQQRVKKALQMHWMLKTQFSGASSVHDSGFDIREAYDFDSL